MYENHYKNWKKKIFLKFFSDDPQEKIYEDGTTEEGTSEDTVPTWDSSLAYSTDETTAEKEEKEEDEDDDDEGLPAKLNKLPNNFFSCLIISKHFWF